MQECLNKLSIKNINSGITNGMDWNEASGDLLNSYSPVDGSLLAKVKQADDNDYEKILLKAQKAFKKWRMVPAPQRGLIVKEINIALEANKETLGRLITLEQGKILSEGLGEVQEMLDIADFALGLSRQLYGLTMHSERPGHRMYEQWHSLGIVGVITSFNFPAAVWAWNAMIAAVCGDVIIWKPSSKTPLTAIAVHNIIQPVIRKYDIEGVFNLIIGKGNEIGEKLINDKRIPLISATGSFNMGRRIGVAVANRFGRSLLELGGNNAIIITPDADLDLAVKATLFGAVGTAGQRCTSTRRLIVHNSVKQQVIEKLKKAYAKIKIGNPLDKNTIMGPLIDEQAVITMMKAIDLAKEQGGKVISGGKLLTIPDLENGFYVEPVIIDAPQDLQVMQQETFAPVLYIVGYDDFEQALDLHNSVDQGLSSAIFTDSLRLSEKFLSNEGSDCGIANVNIATNGAEIGGAFGGEKDTGGGRESGSDAWKIYMRRQTNMINWSDELPLAQGVEFDL